MFQEVEKWDQEMERSAEKSKKAKLQSVEGTDYKVDGVYDGYPVWELISNKAFREESMYMGHCVGQAEGEGKVTSVEGGESHYFRSYKERELRIYSLRDPKEHNHPAVTFELRKVYGEINNFVIVQIKGPANRSVSERYRKACRQFIEDWELVVKEDGQNIGMVKWDKKFYFKDSDTFENIYHFYIIPEQKKRISYVMELIENDENKEIHEDIDLSQLFLTKLPDFKNIKFNYSFNCHQNQLTSLEGAPQTVNGSFNCSHNQLTTLEGAPKKVSYEFICSDNNLTSLEGAPQEVGNSIKGSKKKFYCENNPVNFTEQNIEEAMQKSKEQNSTKLESFKEFFSEMKCWDGYEAHGKKWIKKNGKKKKVNNCVKK